MKGLQKIILLFCFSVFVCSCVPKTDKFKEIGKVPDIFPDYSNVTIPCNIAPLNFRIEKEHNKAVLEIKGEGKSLKIASPNGSFTIPQKKWEKLLQINKGKSLVFTVFKKNKEGWGKYDPFTIYVSTDSIDAYLAYRLIEPGYKLWSEMGIYQRNLESFNQSPIYENKSTGHNCVNCHSFRMNNPNEMTFHMRGYNVGTMLAKDRKIEKLNTQTDSTISKFVYPYWHPTGRFIAFSLNHTEQVFYLHNRNRIEVYDSKSDVAIYDIKTHEVFTSPLLSSETSFETFPNFSPDGKTLFFCTAKPNTVPENSDSVQYSLCALSFDAETQRFGSNVDTLFNAKKLEKSVAFPRVSPDGKHLLFTVADYGCFPIWHKESDLYLYNLKTKKYVNMSNVNSADVDSYHSWSSNSKWFVFSSRRVDGLYTRPFIAHIDENGKTGKAFMLPQKNPAFYDECMKSYNIPEFIIGPVTTDAYRLANESGTDGIDVNFRSN